jgi:hypothetical protein
MTIHVILPATPELPILSEFTTKSSKYVLSYLKSLNDAGKLFLRFIGLWRCYINITITILDIIHRPAFYLKLNSTL